jgi:integrase
MKDPSTRLVKRETTTGQVWAVVIEAGRDPRTGRRRRVVRSGFDTRAAARAAARTAIEELAAETATPTGRGTLADWLRMWLDGQRRARVRENTRATDETYVTAYVIPRIGSLRLRDVTPDKLTGFYSDLLREGRIRDGGPLAPKTVRNVHVMLHRALEDALDEGRIVRNPAGKAKPPPASKAARSPGAMTTWTAEQAQSFLRSVAGDRLAPLWTLALTSGMRRSEMLGLRWRDVDLEDGRCQVAQTIIEVRGRPTVGRPKTARSARSIDLDEGTVEALREHRRRQAEERLAWGPSYQETELAFATEDGAMPRPSEISRRFGLAVRDSGVPRIRLHDTRHTWATLALQADVHPKVVQERLGHASINITMDTYSHVMRGMGRDAAELVGGLVLGKTGTSGGTSASETVGDLEARRGTPGV